MRLSALLLSVLLPIALVLPAQTSAVCACLAVKEISAQSCCAQPSDCCLESGAPAAHSEEWVWERVSVTLAGPAATAILPPQAEMSDKGARLKKAQHSRAPPWSGKRLCALHQHWLI
jgi:hypothetical protein